MQKTGAGQVISKNAGTRCFFIRALVLEARDDCYLTKNAIIKTISLNKK